MSEFQQVGGISFNSTTQQPHYQFLLNQFQGLWLLQPCSYSMHHCLQIQELLSIIFCHYDGAYDSKMLARLARTCKAFQDPALDILWHAQKTLLPLLKCLPPNAWAVKERKFVSHISQACFSLVSHTIPKCHHRVSSGI